ncbi:flagellin modification protein PseA [Helicobacter jaachi]|uniref:Flagellin modification protein PseA n=1 Tax=Helicobacter jaachi TaxID=1677920 RepID=A0A4U8T7X9_9HELI|nr:flagellin modification protein PseA [Helicobacter jaachi]
MSGGKDSHMIVKRLIEHHGVTNPLLVTTYDECTRTQAGAHNLNNIATHFDIDHITYRYKPKTFKTQMKECFEKYLNPYMLAELRLGSFESEVVRIARAFGVRDVFYGEDAAFEYGSTKECNIFHKDSNEQIKFIFMGAIYPYGYLDSLHEAKSVGFKDLEDFHEWYRQGAVEHFAQIDSIGYMVQYWCKFVKFGAQRTTDMATRLCREGAITREQALVYINEYDHILDPLAKYDICQTMGISETYFDEIVDKHANRDIVIKDAIGIWRRKKRVI